MTVADTTSEFVEWNEFLDDFAWSQGEHVTLIGPTGSGKSTLTNSIIPMRRYVIFLATKKRDKTVDWLKANADFTEVNDIAMIHPEIASRIIFKPDFPKVTADELRAIHRGKFQPVLTMAFRAGGWTVVADEVRYLSEFLNLKSDLELLWLQGRSLHVTLVAGTQRPKAIPLTAYDQATHLFLWRDNDHENLKRIGGLGGIDSKSVRAEVSVLPRHEVLYLNTRTGARIRTKVEV